MVIVEHQRPTVTLADRLRQRHQPPGEPVMHQSWRRLLFLHWKVPASVVQSSLPPGLHVDTFEGDAYIGLVPFFMHDIRWSHLPPIPGTANFLETNVRTYVVDDHGCPGVWFYSLDASNLLAVLTARLFFHLPYKWSSMQAYGNEIVTYHLRRRFSGASPSYYRYATVGEKQVTEPGSLAFFLVERYVLFAHDARQNRLGSGRVHHPPYSVCEARVEAYDEELLRMAGLELPVKEPVSMLYSPGVDVGVYPIRWQ